MTVTRDLNLGTVITIALFLILHGAGVAYWMGFSQRSIEENTKSVEAALASVSSVEAKLTATQSLQWDRINKLEDAIQITLSDRRVSDVVVNRLENELEKISTNVIAIQAHLAFGDVMPKAFPARPAPEPR